jgi:hypothetical protein
MRRQECWVNAVCAEELAVVKAKVKARAAQSVVCCCESDSQSDTPEHRTQSPRVNRPANGTQKLACAGMAPADGSALDASPLRYLNLSSDPSSTAVVVNFVVAITRGPQEMSGPAKHRCKELPPSDTRIPCCRVG